MRRRRKLPPDTRPKWNDPLLEIHVYDEIVSVYDWKRESELTMEDYDSLSREERDQEKYAG